MSSEDNSRIDRREARRAMADKIFCILFPCFSPPDDSPLREGLASENQPVSQRPSTSAGGDLPSEDLPVSQRPSTSEGGDSASEDQPVSQQPSTSECGDLPSEDLPVSQRPTTSEGGDLASEDHLVSQRPSTSESGGLPSEKTEDKIIAYIKQRSNTGDLDGFIEILSRFDRIAKGKSLCQEPEQTYLSRFTWLNNSGGLKKLGEILSKLIECASALKECFQSGPVLSLIENIGKANVATAGLLAVAYVLETVEQISENNEECLRLLKEIYFLAQLVNQLKDSQIEVQTLIERATELVVQEAITLVKQIESDGLCKWWSASINEGDLRKTERQITSMYQNINAHMGIRLLNAVERNNQPRLSRGYPEHAVGMEDAFRAVMGLIEWGSPKKAIGVILYGFGGMGKTTLADAVFSRVDLDGCRYSMVELCENMDLTKIVELQKDILKDLMGTKNIPEFRKHEEGRRLLSRKLEEVPALIYIDNVLDKDNLRQLLPLKLDKAKKVRLLITARDRNVRKACPMETPPTEYPMTGISSAASKSLLEKQLHGPAKNLLAHGMTNNMEGNSDSNVDHIIQKCGGIPLLLTLVAHELCCAKDTHEVRQVIEELEKLEGEEFGEKLESCFFVYDKLPQQCQEPFLDICSCFEGWDWDTVADILGNSALDKLERRALVTKGANGAVTVNEVILKIGRRRAEGVRFRFTTTSELQKEDQKVEQIRYLRYRHPKHLDQLSKMPSNLKYMEIDGKFNCNDLKSFPVRLLRLPDLRILKLTNFEGLKELPSELAHLVKDLRQLTLSNCKSLEELPYPISNLKSLRVLKVDNCNSLKVFPRDFGNLKSLVELDLSNCKTLSQLPEDLGSLSALQQLNLNKCQSLKNLPDDFERLSSLKVLNLSSCTALKHLPDGLGKIASIVKLDVSRCKKLDSIPESIKHLTSLSSMDISYCESLTKLPDGFCKLSLTFLKLNNCIALENLPELFGELKPLTVLRLKSCNKLRKLPESFSRLWNLVHLDLSGCSGLEELCKEFHGLSSLQTLSLDGCRNLKKLPTNFHSLSKLQHLDLSNCHMLEAECMNNMEKIVSLTMLYITESVNLVKRWGEIQGHQSRAYKEGTGQGEIQGHQSRAYKEDTGREEIQGHQSRAYKYKVDIGQDLSEEAKENEWKNLSGELERLYKHGRPEPFKVSSRPPNTILLLMFDGQSDFNQDFPWPLIEETLDDIKIKFEMLYIGKHFHKLPRKVAHKIMGRAVDNSDARLLLEKVLFNLKRNDKNLWHRNMNKFFAMSAKIVQQENDDKYLSCWELLIDGKDFAKMEEFLLSKCGKYHSFKRLEEGTQESNIHLLRELFVNGCEENCLLREQQEVSVEELKGKPILIEIRFADESHDHPGLQCLSDMYMTGKGRPDFEIISIPIGQLREAPREPPWLVVQNPSKVRRVVKYFLTPKRNPEITESWISWYPSVVRRIEPNGKIAPYKPIWSILDRWGSDAYPFTDEKIEELRNKEWKQQQSMSCLEFLLFKSLKGDELAEVKREIQGKMTWLLCNGKDPDTHRERSKTLGKNIKEALKNAKMKNVYFICVPAFDEKKKEEIPVTDSMKMAYFPTQDSEMPQEKGKLGLEHVLYLSQWASVRFWARVHDFREHIEGMDEKAKQWDGMRTLLKSLKFGVLSMALMDEKGEMVTTKGREIMDLFDTTEGKRTGLATPQKERAKALVGDLMKGPEEKRKDALLELTVLATRAKTGSSSSGTV